MSEQTSTPPAASAQPDACEPNTIRSALIFVVQTLRGHRYNWEHDRDEESGQHDEDCRACEYEAILGRAEDALERNPPTPPPAREVADIARAIANLEHVRDVFDGFGRYSERDGVKDAIATLHTLSALPKPAEPAGDVAEIVAGLRAVAIFFAADADYADYKKHRKVIDRAIAALQAGEARGRWLPWKPGDALPPYCGSRWYRTARMIGEKLVMEDLFPGVFERHGVIAYWSEPLPPAFNATLLDEWAGKGETT